MNDDQEIIVGYEDRPIASRCHRTLYVEGTVDSKTLNDYIEQEGIEAICFGTKGSFVPHDEVIMAEWIDMMQEMLDHDSRPLVALEYDPVFHTDVLETVLVENPRFIPIIMLRLPYIRQLPYHAAICISDNLDVQTNPGTWTHNVHDLTATSSFTMVPKPVDK